MLRTIEIRDPFRDHELVWRGEVDVPLSLEGVSPITSIRLNKAAEVRLTWEIDLHDERLRVLHAYLRQGSKRRGQIAERITLPEPESWRAEVARTADC